MKRIVMSALSVFFVAALIGLTGCEGGGVETGMPDAATKPDISIDKMKDMANMASGTTPPPGVSGKKIPTKGTDAGVPAEKDKDAPKN